jgi:hypothetical protein
MKIHQNDFSRIKKVCNHEAGHYILAREMKFKTHGISATFTFPQGHSGSSGSEPWTPLITSVQDIEDYLERRVQVLYAGVISEAMDIKGNYNSDYALNEWRNGGGKDDYSKFRELIQVLRNIKHPETNDQQNAQKQLDFIDNLLIQKTGGIVHNRIELIYEVGDFLFRKVKEYNIKYELTEDEINQIPSIKTLFGE